MKNMVILLELVWGQRLFVNYYLKWILIRNYRIFKKNLMVLLVKEELNLLRD